LIGEVQNKLWSGSFREPKLNSDALENPENRTGNCLYIREVPADSGKNGRLQTGAM
jgi:hypothetical protein